MKQLQLFGRITAITALFLLLNTDVIAQSAGDEHRYAVKIQGLTTEDRDALQRQLAGHSDLKLVFACVPAGILVFESTTNGTREQVKQRSLPMVQPHIRAERITELDHGLADAETACAQQRNR